MFARLRSSSSELGVGNVQKGHSCRLANKSVDDRGTDAGSPASDHYSLAPQARIAGAQYAHVRVPALSRAPGSPAPNSFIAMALRSPE